MSFEDCCRLMDWTTENILNMHRITHIRCLVFSQSVRFINSFVYFCLRLFCLIGMATWILGISSKSYRVFYVHVVQLNLCMTHCGIGTCIWALKTGSSLVNLLAFYPFIAKSIFKSVLIYHKKILKTIYTTYFLDMLSWILRCRHVQSRD